MTRSDRTTTRAAGVLGPPRRRASALLFHCLPLTFGFNRVGFFRFFPGDASILWRARRFARSRRGRASQSTLTTIGRRPSCLGRRRHRVPCLRNQSREASAVRERASAVGPIRLRPIRRHPIHRIVPLGLPIQKPFILALPPVSAAPPASPRGAPGCPRRWRSSRNPSRSASPVRPPRPPETSRSSTSPT